MIVEKEEKEGFYGGRQAFLDGKPNDVAYKTYCNKTTGRHEDDVAWRLGWVCAQEISSLNPLIKWWLKLLCFLGYHNWDGHTSSDYPKPRCKRCAKRCKYCTSSLFY